MLQYVLRRLVYAIITFFGITVATFVLIHAVPGDPTDFYISRVGFDVSRESLEAIRREFHLDRPMALQYVYWVRNILTLDLGRSIVDHRPVAERIAERMWPTLELNLLALLLSALIGIPIGLWSAARSGRLGERASAVGFFLLYSLPSFWVALILMQVFSVRLGIFPLFGMRSVEPGAELTVRLTDHLRHLVLPVITLSYAQVAIFARFSKSAVVEVIRQDFVTTARAKGAGPGVVLWRHAFRNALLPLITLLGLTIPYLISGSVIVEQIFQWEGIGKLYFDSILSRDYPVVLGLTVATAVVTLVASLIADLLYAVADPRIALEGRR